MGRSRLADVERPRLGDEVYKHPLINTSRPVMDPSDHLPKQTSTTAMSDTLAPALMPETFVCMGDASEFVVRDGWGEIYLRFTPDRVLVSPNGGYYVGELLTPEVEQARLGGFFDVPHARLSVEPLRPQCAYYRRVMTDFEQSDEHRQVERVCSAQRGETGEFVSLNNTRVYACEHRSPRDFVSEDRLRRFDERLVAATKKTEEEWTPPVEG